MNTNNSNVTEVTSRYSIIEEKNKREIVLLRGNGCVWRRCRFCDYHLDFSRDQEANDTLNTTALSQVTGIYHSLEVINSGSFVDLSKNTMQQIEETCLAKNISELSFESHYMHRHEIPKLKDYFFSKGITVKMKIGVETFDMIFRESYLDKGITTNDPSEIAKYFDACCLLQGIPGQNLASMESDITTGLKYFERVCINIMIENTTKIKPDPRVINEFITHLYPRYYKDPRVDILIDNTDFGVGGLTTND